MRFTAETLLPPATFAMSASSRYGETGLPRTNDRRGQPVTISPPQIFSSGKPRGRSLPVRAARANRTPLGKKNFHLLLLARTNADIFRAAEIAGIRPRRSIFVTISVLAGLDADADFLNARRIKFNQVDNETARRAMPSAPTTGNNSFLTACDAGKMTRVPRRRWNDGLCE